MSSGVRPQFTRNTSLSILFGHWTYHGKCIFSKRENDRMIVRTSMANPFSARKHMLISDFTEWIINIWAFMSAYLTHFWSVLCKKQKLLTWKVSSYCFCIAKFILVHHWFFLFQGPSPSVYVTAGVKGRRGKRFTRGGDRRKIWAA